MDGDTVSKVIGFLFPWRNTFRRLELEKRWWHRLAIVLLFVALAPTLVYSWVIADDACSPVNRFEPDIAYLGGPPPGGTFDANPVPPPPGYSASDVVATSNQPAPKGDIFDQVAGNQAASSPPKPPPTIQKTIEMPDDGERASLFLDQRR